MLEMARLIRSLGRHQQYIVEGLLEISSFSVIFSFSMDLKGLGSMILSKASALKYLFKCS